MYTLAITGFSAVAYAVVGGVMVAFGAVVKNASKRRRGK